MSITSCTLDRAQGKPAVISGTPSGGVTASVSAQWRILTDGNDNTQLAVYLAAQSGSPDPLPAVYTAYDVNGDSDTGLFAQSVTLTQNPKALNNWIARVDYAPPGQGQSSGDFKVHPWNRPPKYWLETEQFTDVIENGWNTTTIQHPDGTVSRAANTFGSIVNAALEDFDLPVEEQRNRLIYVRQRNVATLQPIITTHNIFDGTLNNGTFYGAPAMCARFKSVTCSREIEEPWGSGVVKYYQEVVRVAISRTPFTKPIVNRGWKYRTGSGTTWTLTDVTGSEPVLLTAKGELLPDKTIGNTIEYRTRPLQNYYPLS